MCPTNTTYMFNTKFNLSFGAPRSDTCSFCDSMATKMKVVGLEDEERERLQQQLILHQRQAQAFHAKKRRAKAEAQANRHIVALSFNYCQYPASAKHVYQSGVLCEAAMVLHIRNTCFCHQSSRYVCI